MATSRRREFVDALTGRFREEVERSLDELEQSGIPVTLDRIESLVTEVKERLGRESTSEELAAYRQLLWAFAITISALDRPPRTAADATTPPSCPVPQSMLGSRPNQTIDKF